MRLGRSQGNGKLTSQTERSSVSEEFSFDKDKGRDEQTERDQDLSVQLTTTSQYYIAKCSLR